MPILSHQFPVPVVVEVMVMGVVVDEDVGIVVLVVVDAEVIVVVAVVEEEEVLVADEAQEDIKRVAAIRHVRSPQITFIFT